MDAAIEQSNAPSAPVWAEELLGWFQTEQRPFPWRRRPQTPFRTWVSEVMLQQTRAETAATYFERFLACFPDVSALAAASQEEVLRVWEGLGYYARARNLHAAARLVVERYGGRLPRTECELRKLPGLGPYTAAAVASLAFGEPVPAMDGNVLRVMARFLALDHSVREAGVREYIRSVLAPVLRNVTPGPFNEALMELGALVCTPRGPRCGDCPLRTACRAHAEGRAAELPVRPPRRRIPHYAVAVGIVWKEGKVLIGRRRTDRMLGGLWEFPGGKVEPGESPVEAVVREIREETGIEVAVVDRLCTVKHAYTHFRVTLTAFECRWEAGQAVANSADCVRWVNPDDLADYPFPVANRRIIHALALRGGRQADGAGTCQNSSMGAW
ncbi:MAG: A/G-specific adenine glycosylase [Kiritimatiellaeota bacterium]|nr:A/G-specific adenine glycosylase [Kiritimatiellota bacterium]